MQHEAAFFSKVAIKQEQQQLCFTHLSCTFPYSIL